MGYFITNQIKISGAAISLGQNPGAIEAVNITLTGNPNDIYSYQLSKIESVRLSNVPVYENKEYRVTLKSGTTRSFGYQTFDLAGRSEIQVTIALEDGTRYNDQTNKIILPNGQEVGSLNIVIGHRKE